MHSFECCIQLCIFDTFCSEGSKAGGLYLMHSFECCIQLCIFGYSHILLSWCDVDPNLILWGAHIVLFMWQCKDCGAEVSRRSEILKHYRLKHSHFGCGRHMKCMYPNCE